MQLHCYLSIYLLIFLSITHSDSPITFDFMCYFVIIYRTESAAISNTSPAKNVVTGVIKLIWELFSFEIVAFYGQTFYPASFILIETFLELFLVISSSSFLVFPFISPTPWHPVPLKWDFIFAAGCDTRGEIRGIYASPQTASQAMIEALWCGEATTHYTLSLKAHLETTEMCKNFII